jgi:UrcA family protein
MNTRTSTTQVTVSRPEVTLLMVLCGIVGTAAAGAVSAAMPADPAPSLAVHYDAQSLATDAGAKAVYLRLVRAAETVCPAVNTGSRLVSNVILQCRQQAIARAVHQINNPRLAALSSPRPKTG